MTHDTSDDNLPLPEPIIACDQCQTEGVDPVTLTVSVCDTHEELLKDILGPMDSAPQPPNHSDEDE